MIGSPAIAGWIAHLAFWILLAWGWAAGELGLRGLAIFIIFWVVGLFGLPYAPYGAALFPSYVALLDVMLVLAVFKGDVPVS